MTKIKTIKFFYIFIFFFLVSSLIIAENKIKPLDVKKIANGVYVHYGKHENIYEGNIGDIANLGFIIGDESIAVVDTGGSFIVGEALRLAIRQISDKPIKYVINTHVHQDHIFGNNAFVPEGALVYGHYKLKQAIRERGSQYLAQLNQIGDKKKNTKIIMPHKIIATLSNDGRKKISNQIIIDLGNRQLQLTSYEVAHTYADASVYDLKTKTLFTGDLVSDERLPTMDGLAKNWIKVLNQIEKINFDIMVPGHGKIQTDNTALNKTKKYLQILYDEVIEALKKDIPIEEGLKTIAQREKNNWVLFDRVNPGNIVRTFMRYEWEY